MFAGVGKYPALLCSLLFVLSLFRSVAISADRSSSGGQRHRQRSASSDDGQYNGEGVASEAEAPGEFNASLSGNCTHCNNREIKRSYRLASIKNDIMRKLRMSSPPNVTGRRLPDIPQLSKIRDLHTYQNDSPRLDDSGKGLSDDGDESYATTIKMILFAQPAPVEVAGNLSNVFYFNFQPELTYQTIIKAQLGVYIRRPQSAGPFTTWILIYRLHPLTPTTGVPQVRDMVRLKKILLSNETNMWHQFEVKQAVQNWINSTIYGILIQTSDATGTPLAVVQPETPDEEVLKPYLEIHVQDQSTTRSRRTVEHICDETSDEKRCCRYPLAVDFESFGWDWVIVPKRYLAYYCAGECTFQFYQRYPHTGLAQQANRESGAGGPCCSPRKTSPISMLYYDEYMNIVYGRLPEMVVDQCDCS